MAATSGGTVISNTATVDFVDLSGSQTLLSNQTNVTVNSVTQITILPSRTEVLQAGDFIDIVHTVTNDGNVNDTVNLEATVPAGLSAAFFAADGVTPLTDSDSDGRIDTGVLTESTSRDIVVRVTADISMTPGSVHNVLVNGTSAVNPTVNGSITDTYTILQAQFWDPLVKTVSPAGQVTPGTIVTYTNTFGNSGNIPATNIVITDILDANLIYISGSATEPAGISGTTIVYDPVVRTVTWTIPSIPAGYVGTIQFQSRIDPAILSDTTVQNTISMTSDQTPVAQVSNAVANVVVEQPLRLNKSANRTVAEIGDYVVYSVTVENVSTTMTASSVMITDNLPQGFRYLEGSSFLDNTLVSDPIGGTTSQWAIGALAPGESKTLKYRTIISIDAPLGNGTNTAAATGSSPGGNNLFTGPARATVKIEEGVLNSRTIILGRVFVDQNRDKMPDADEPGMEGVRLYLEDGSHAITDGAGKYSFVGITAGDHVVKIDKSTITDGFISVPHSNAFAGDGGSQFITAPYGGPARGDFALVSQDPDKEQNEAEDQEKNSKKKRKGQFTFGVNNNAAPLPWEKQIFSMPSTPEILEPKDGTVLEKKWSHIVIRVPDSAEYILRVNGIPLLESQIGKTIEETNKKIRISQYVGVNLNAGSNIISLEIHKPDGSQEAQEVVVIVPGNPEKVVISPEKADIPADGKTVVPFTIHLLDQWNRATTGKQILTVFLEKGEIVEKDLDPSREGHQIRSNKGIAKFKLRAPLTSGQEDFQVSLGTNLNATADIYYTAALRDWIVVGLGTLTVGNSDIQGRVEKITEDDRFDDEIYHDERLAFFAKGKILGKYLLTAAYDSGKEERDGLFQQIDPEKYYPIYGDASEAGYEAESQKKLYLKLEKGRSSVLVGDFNADFSDTELSRYTRAFNGIKADINTDRQTLKTFVSETNHTFTKDEIPGDGTSGYYFLSKKPVIENSERIHIEVRDRFHSERIISSVEKTRYTDYTIDYVTGAILFKEPVASLDSNLNPVTIVVEYESDDPGDKYYIYGTRGVVRSKNGSNIGVSAVVEENALKDSTLYGADGELKLTEKTSIKGEVAASDTLAKGKGNAWKVELSTKVKKLQLDTYYRDVEAEFENPSMTGNESGTEKYGAKADYDVTEKTRITAESFVQADTVNDTELAKNSIGVQQQISKVKTEAGFQHIEESSATDPDKKSDMVYAEAASSLTKKLGASLRREQALTATTVEDYPTRTALKLDYRLTDKTRAYLTEEYQEGEDNRNITVLGMESKLNDHMALSTGYQMEDSADGLSQLNNVELNTKWGGDSPLSLGTKTGYQLENSLSGERSQAILGLNTAYEILNGLTLRSTAEMLENIESGDGGDRKTFTLGAEYLKSDEYKVSGRYELRLTDSDTTTLYSIGGAIKYSDSLSFLGKMSLWNSDKDTGTDILFDSSLGFAYRALGKKSHYNLSTLRYKLDKKGSTATGDEVKSLIASTESSYRFTPRWTLTGKYAGKYSWEILDDKSFNSYTDLLITGLTYDITDRWDVGVFGKVMNQYSTRTLSTGGTIKAGYRIFKNAYLGLGYNLSELRDRDLEGEDYQRQGFFLEFKFKFDETSFDFKRKTRKEPEVPVLAPTEIPAPLPDLTSVPEPTKLYAVLNSTWAEEFVNIIGSLEMPALYMNGQRAVLPEVDIQLQDLFHDILEINGALVQPMQFKIKAVSAAEVDQWNCLIMTNNGAVFHTITGKDGLPESIAWNGRTENNEPLEGGNVYHYQLEVRFSDGSKASSPRRVFGVNRINPVSLRLSGGAFEFNSDILSVEAKDALEMHAEIMRVYPEQKIVIEGHSDSVGSAEANLEVSKRRSEAAQTFMVSDENIPSTRIITRWFGEERPITSNALPEGRALNRRIEVKGEYEEIIRTDIRELYRATPQVKINGTFLDVDDHGRFAGTLSAAGETMTVYMADSQGKSIQTSVQVPDLQIVNLEEETKLPWGATSKKFRFTHTDIASADQDDEVMVYRLSGKTAPGNRVEVDKIEIEVDADGSFVADLKLKKGKNLFGVVVENHSGCRRLSHLQVNLSLDEEKLLARAREK